MMMIVNFGGVVVVGWFKQAIWIFWHFNIQDMADNAIIS